MVKAPVAQTAILRQPYLEIEHQTDESLALETT
jgi:hypothetical protein